MKMNITEVVTKFWEYATKEVENKYQHDVIKGAAYREGIFNGILYASQVEPIPTKEGVLSAEEVLYKHSSNSITKHPNKIRTEILAAMHEYASQFKPQPIEEGVSFKQSDWDAFKLRMGDRNYQGVINIEDFVKIIGELEDKKLKSKEEGVSKEADKIQKAIDFCDVKVRRNSFEIIEAINEIKQYLLSIK